MKFCFIKLFNFGIPYICIGHIFLSKIDIGSFYFIDLHQISMKTFYNTQYFLFYLLFSLIPIIWMDVKQINFHTFIYAIAHWYVIVVREYLFKYLTT